jgi:hypothetical protein
MAKVLPYHTVEPELPPERNVYHDHDDCPTGRRIERRHWREEPLTDRAVRTCGVHTSTSSSALSKR